MLPGKYKEIALEALERTPCFDREEDGGRYVQTREFRNVLARLRGPRVDVEAYIVALEDSFVVERRGPVLYVLPPIPKPKKTKEPKETKEA